MLNTGNRENLGQDWELRQRLWEQNALAPGGGLALTTVHSYPLASLFAYHGEVRRLILDFKIRGSWQSGVALVDLFARDPTVRAFAADAACLVPVPSSFWGRWNGKHDLAFALAEGLSDELRLPLKKGPWSKYFRLKKQSFLSRSNRHSERSLTIAPLSWQDPLKAFSEPSQKTASSLCEAPRVVLIDDIVTTANTLTAFASSFRNIGFQFLTLASAYHKTGDTIRSAGENL